MTSGNIITDNRRTVGLVVGFAGSYFSKAWTGADEAPRQKRPPRTYRTIKRYKFEGNRRVLAYRYRIPNYTAPPKRARLGEHAYDVTYVSQRDMAVTVTSTGKSGGALAVAGNAYPSGSWETWATPIPLDANDQIKLVNKLREKLQGSDFNMSVFLGEGHQTLRMIGDTAITLAKAIRELKSLKPTAFISAARQLGVHAPKGSGTRRVTVDNISSRWLELQYGWKPLLDDVKNGAEQLAHHLNVPFSSTYRVSVRKEQTVKVQSLSAISGGPVDWVGTSVKSSRRSLVARISEPPTIPQLLGLMDPELVAWELLPYSFVADWFAPIGPWLQARALASRLKGTFITSDKLDSMSTGLVFTKGVIPLGTTTTRYANTRFTRSISTSLAVPMPNVKPLEKALSLQHCLNGLALLANAFKPRPIKPAGTVSLQESSRKTGAILPESAWML